MVFFVISQIEHETTFQNYGGESVNKCNSKVLCAKLITDFFYITEVLK